jgi:hypothetical protein
MRPEPYGRRRTESDAGESLQTDVMRFFAILALCLVAIFALVQRLPPPAVPAGDQAADARPIDPPPSGRPPSPSAAARVAAHPARATAPATRPGQQAPAPPPQIAPVSKVPAVGQPESPAVETTGPPRADSVPPAHAPDRLVLRFASDDALLALVAQGRVGVFAVRDGEAWQLEIARGRLRFEPATAPRRYHGMRAATVPPAVHAALAAAASPTAAALDWRVTLQDELWQRIDGLAGRHPSGTLLIEASGAVRHGPGA